MRMRIATGALLGGALILSSCALPQSLEEISGSAAGLPLPVAPVAQATVFGPKRSPIKSADEGGEAKPEKARAGRHSDRPDFGLGLSDEVVPYQEFGQGLREEFPTLTQRLDDAVFESNRESVDAIDEPDLPVMSAERRPPRQSVLGNLGTEPFLAPGPVDTGFELPTGATWHPEFFVFGTLRTGVQTFRTESRDVTEWANRLDLFGNLSLSATERILIGFRPLDREGEFTGYAYDHKKGSGGTVNGFDASPQALFFEGDLGQIFPSLASRNEINLDYQFSVGRQPLLFQDGLMLNDTVDAIGVTRHNLFLFGASATRLSAFWGWGDLHRDDHRLDGGSRLYAVSSTLDYPDATLEIDAAYVDGSSETGGDGAYLGIGRIRSFGLWGSTLRANASWALAGEDSAGVGTGYLLSHELSRSFGDHHDLFYWNAWLGIDRYTSVARDPATGGPLGRLGLLNRAVGLGQYDAPLSNRSGDVVGAAIGIQHFFDVAAERQILFELGGRLPYGDGNGENAEGGIGAQYQYNFGPGIVFIASGFGSLDEDGETGFGGRCELLFKF